MLAAVIGACDSAAYFVGRFVGGAKLAPAISPNKTISGSVGGIVAAIAVMLGIAPFLELSLLMALLLGFGLAVLSQIGDLLESALKRRVNVKDSGSILPGHGGLLDRFDGYLITVPGFYIFLFVI
jgi:phosphatidate cytidylyltransferase